MEKNKRSVYFKTFDVITTSLNFTTSEYQWFRFRYDLVNIRISVCDNVGVGVYIDVM